MNIDFYYLEDSKKLIECINSDDNTQVLYKGIKMKKYDANTVDASKEKHLPVATINNNMLYVTVGSVEHPMQEEHLINAIYIVTDTKTVLKKVLKPGEKPELTFDMAGCTSANIYAYCNLHGVWMAHVEV